MATESVLAFWAVALLLIVVPGADWAFTISAGVRGRSILSAVGGLAIGYTAVTLVIAAGVGALVAGSPATLTGLSVLGGIYLMWQGAVTFAKPATPSSPASASPSTDWNTFIKGIGVSGLNPKALVMFLALLPQFTNPHWTWSITGQIAALGSIFTLTCAIFYLYLGSAARTLLQTRPAAARATSRLSGAAMIIIGAAILIERLAQLA